jgi:hypothetical protein
MTEVVGVFVRFFVRRFSRSSTLKANVIIENAMPGQFKAASSGV